MARNLKITDSKLFYGIRAALQQSMRFSQQTQNFVRSKGVAIRFHGRRKNEPAHYCGTCDEEVRLPKIWGKLDISMISVNSKFFVEFCEFKNFR